jgi:hypothetical protein
MEEILKVFGQKIQICEAVVACGVVVVLNRLGMLFLAYLNTTCVWKWGGSENKCLSGLRYHQGNNGNQERKSKPLILLLSFRKEL